MADKDSITRRRLLAGAGAVGGAAVLTAVSASGADAASGSLPGAGATISPHDTPGGISSISSAPEAHTSYRFVTWLDTTPLNAFSNGRSFASHGIYTDVASDFFGVSFDLPAGALLHDVEIYYASTAGVPLSVAVWSSGVANLGNVIATVQLGPWPDITIHATNLPIPSNVNGPFPHGTQLVLYVPTATNQSTQINGFRLGLRNAPLSPVLLPAPIRAYDSRTHDGALAGGATRTVSLAGQVPVGALGALVNLTVTKTVGAGFLTLYSADVAKPGTSSIQWFGSGQSISNQASTAVELTRSVKVSAGGSGSTQFLVDVLGYLV